LASVFFVFWRNLTLVFEVLVPGIMEGRMGLLFLFLLGAAWVCDARELANCGGKIVRLTFSHPFAFLCHAL